MDSRILRIASISTLAAAVGLTGCSEEVKGPEPVVDALTPSLVCGEQLTTEVLIDGDELSPLAIDEATDDPKVAIPDVRVRRVQDLMGASVDGPTADLPNDPADPDSAHVRWMNDGSMAFDVYPDLGLEPGLYEVTVTNRNGNATTLPGALAVVEEPTLEAVQPDMVCLEQGMRSVTLTGSGFLQVGDELPTVLFTSDGQEESYPVDSMSDCFDVPGPTEAQLCTTAQLTIPEDGLVTGAQDVVVRNPEPAACDSSEGDDVTMATVPRPSLDSAEPDLVCSEDAPASMTLSGSDFVAIRDSGGDIFPEVTIGGESVTVTEATGCSAIDGTLMPAESCTTLSVEVPQTLTLSGDQPVVVTNPDPAGCHSEESVDVLVLGSPDIVAFEPSAVCTENQPTEMTAVGEGFLRLDDGSGGLIDPTVTLDGSPIAVTFDPADCTALDSSVASGELCTAFTFAAPTGGFAEGTHAVNITNPEPASCSDTEEFGVASTPTIDSVDPFKVCSSGGGDFTVTGSGFVAGSEILLDGTPVQTSYVSSTELTGTVPDGFTPDTYDVGVQNGAGCESSTLVEALEVVDDPVVFFADPRTIYSGIDMRLTVWVSGIEGASPTVSLRESGTSNTVQLLDPEYNGENRIFATATTDMNLTAGSYDVIVDDDPCDAELAEAVTVTDDLSVYVSGIDPAFGISSTDPSEDSTVDNTGVTVFSDMDTTPSGLDNFQKTPRIYLNPITGTDPASELQAVQWLDDPYRVDGVVPSHLAAGDYQIVVINPDGGVGILEDQLFRMLPNDDPPPEITALDPGQVNDTTGQAVDILGESFPTDTANLAVSAVCRDPRAADPESTETSLTQNNGGVAVDSTSANLIATTWDMTGLNGYTCVVRVSNLANGSHADFSAITVVDSSGNLPDFFSSGHTLVTGRRALSGAAIRMNDTSRFLFAIGGDDGATTPTQYASVESAPVDPFGTILTDFTVQRNALPEPRAFAQGAAAVIGRYVYVAGGRTGAAGGTVDGALMRAYLLDPFESPEISDLSLDLAESGDGLAEGVWYYRVSAVMDDGSVVAADPNNPGGEGLPSDPLAVQIPGFAEPIHLTLHWDHIDGAVGYRIYRTQAPDGVSGDEVLLGTMDTETDLGNIVDDGGTPLATQSFLDTGIDNSGTDATDPANLPMPLGSLGVWHQVGTLDTAREGAALVAVPNYLCLPDCTSPTSFVPDPTKSFLYVIGGRDDQGNYLDSVEWIEVQTLASNEQNLVDPQDSTQSAFRVSSEVLPTDGLGKGPRWLLGAVYMDDRKSTVVGAPEVYLYALPGEDAPGGAGAVNHVTAFAVDTTDGTDDGDTFDGDGSLSGATNVEAPNSKYTGYGYASNHNFLHLIGGKTGAPSNAGDESFIVSPAPTLDPWDAGTTLLEARWLHATAYESAFVFQIGGQTSVDASDTVEQSNF